MELREDYPKKSKSHVIEVAAEAAFSAAISSVGLFQEQSREEKDYGTDRQIAVVDRDDVTNFRVHVQLKGTEGIANADNSVSIEVRRSNLVYLLGQHDSIYVGWHIPSQRLLARYATSVVRDYEHRGENWQEQSKITVRLTQPFDRTFQERLHARALANGRANRNRQLEWLVAPPNETARLAKRDVPLVPVSPDVKLAAEQLASLYRAGSDDVISRSFTLFQAVLKDWPSLLTPAYLAEINLAINNFEFDKQRVIDAREMLRQQLGSAGQGLGTVLYGIGNACNALGEFGDAKGLYESAIELLSDEKFRKEAASCYKNLGSVLVRLNQKDKAVAAFEKALELNFDLPHAHYVIANELIREEKDLKKALDHLDSISSMAGGIPMSAVQGLRMKVLFLTAEHTAAFREMNSLLEARDKEDWVWPFCASLMARHGRSSVESAQKAVRFWREYLSEHDDLYSKRELVVGLSMLQMQDRPTGESYATFRPRVMELVDAGDSDSAFLLDRLGHWAQGDENWEEAEKAYRSAFEMEPATYGYCFGVALNHLGGFKEALPILLEQAQTHQPDAMSWFQVGFARAGLDDHAGAITAYEWAIELDPDYEAAIFNLAGAHWNARHIPETLSLFRVAIARFPDNPKVSEIRSVLGRFL